LYEIELDVSLDYFSGLHALVGKSYVIFAQASNPRLG